MTKTLFTLLFTCFYITTVFGQSDKEEIKNTIEKYFITVEQKDNAKTIDYVYPRVFDNFPKEKLLELMDQMYSDTSIILNFSNSTVKKISNTLEIDGIKYALVNYSFVLTMIMVPDKNEIENTEATDYDSENFMFETFKEMYGEKNVVYEREKRKFDITLNNNMYAINDPAYKDWKFIEKKENMNPMLEKLLPKKVLRKL